VESDLSVNLDMCDKEILMHLPYAVGMPRKDDILHPQQTPTYHRIYVTGWQAAMHKTGPSHSGAGLCADYRPCSTLYVSGKNSHSCLGHIAK
jgi:hypothetical protein